jgi:hypothetical protein
VESLATTVRFTALKHLFALRVNQDGAVHINEEGQFDQKCAEPSLSRLRHLFQTVLRHHSISHYLFIERHVQTLPWLLSRFSALLGPPIKLRNISQMFPHGMLGAVNIMICNSTKYFGVPGISSWLRGLIF